MQGRVERAGRRVNPVTSEYRCFSVGGSGRQRVLADTSRLRRRRSVRAAGESRSLRSGPPERSGGGPRGWKRAFVSSNGFAVWSYLSGLAACCTAGGGRCLFFSLPIVCWLEPEVGVAPGQTGLLRRRCPLSSRRTAAISCPFGGRAWPNREGVWMDESDSVLSVMWSSGVCQAGVSARVIGRCGAFSSISRYWRTRLNLNPNHKK